MRGRMWIRLMVCSIFVEGLGGVGGGRCVQIGCGVLRHGDLQHNVPEKAVMAVRPFSTRCRYEARTSL